MASTMMTICLYALAAGIRHITAAEREISCLDDVQLRYNSDRSESPEVGLTCTGRRWCTAQEQPDENRAQKPESASVSSYMYKDNAPEEQETAQVEDLSRRIARKRRRIGLRIEWTNKVTDLNDIDGFVIGLHTTGQTFAFSICFEVEMNESIHNIEEDRVKFVYRYECRDDSCLGISQDTMYQVTIISQPGNYDVGFATGVFEQVRTPTLKREKRMRKWSKRSKRKRRQGQSNVVVETTTADTVTVEIPDNFTTASFSSSKGIGFTTFSITLSGIAFSIAFIGWITWGLNAKIGRKRILFLEKISEDLDNPCSYAFQSLIYEIRKSDLADVTYNRWETVKLIPDPVTWIRNAIATADVIIALASPQEGSNDNVSSPFFNEWVNSLIRERRDETRNKKIVLVSFHLKKHDTWPELCDRPNLSKFKLPEELKKLYNTLFNTGPLKCPFNTEEMTTLANEANLRTKCKTQNIEDLSQFLEIYA